MNSDRKKCIKKSKKKKGGNKILPFFKRLLIPASIMAFLPSTKRRTRFTKSQISWKGFRADSLS